MASIHTVIIDKVNYKYHAPKENSEGAIKGIMYEKIDKKTGEMKGGFKDEVQL